MENKFEFQVVKGKYWNENCDRAIWEGEFSNARN
jgi:hypothetical protein